MSTKDPSIHITRSSLIEVLDSIWKPESGFDSVGMANHILKKARPYSIPNRSVVGCTDRIEKKIERVVSSSTSDADLMARMVYAVRKSLKHKGVIQIKPTQRDWDTIKLMANQANSFCMDFELPKREGYIAYIKAGCAKMQQFSLRKFTNLFQAISMFYEATKEIEKDPYQELTEQFHDLYRRKVAFKTGFQNNFKNHPEKYVWFVRLSALFQSYTIPPSVYIDAQFDALAGFDAMPDPTQLLGQKAKERLNKYLYENQIKVRNGNGKNKCN